MNRLFLLYCLLCWLGVPALYSANGHDLARKIISTDAVLAQAEKLGLSATQRQEVERVQNAQRIALAEPLATMRRESGLLVEHLSREKPDEKAMLACFEKLNAAETVLKRERLATTVRLMHILTPSQLTLLQSAALPIAGSAPDLSGATIPEMLQQVRAGIDAWRKAGRDLTTVNAMWERFRRHAEAKEHAEARQTLQEMIKVLSAPLPAQSP